MVVSETNKKIIEDIDHAFELMLVIIVLISGMIVQLVGSPQQVISLPPIIANMHRVSIVFVFPSILIVLAWITAYFQDDETQKMRLKAFAWCLVLFLAIFEVFELYTVSRPENFPEWLNFPLVVLLLFGMLIPIIPYWLYRKILKRYKLVLQSTNFFASGKLAMLFRYLPLLFAYIFFWFAFYLAILV